jgi:hypothetical protein
VVGGTAEVVGQLDKHVGDGGTGTGRTGERGTGERENGERGGRGLILWFG